MGLSTYPPVSTGGTTQLGVNLVTSGSHAIAIPSSNIVQIESTAPLTGTFGGNNFSAPQGLSLIDSTSRQTSIILNGPTAPNFPTFGGATLPSSSNWVSVTYGNGMFVAVANGSTAAAYSTNGSTWTASTLPSSSTWQSVTYGNGMFVAVAYGSTAAAVSVYPIEVYNIILTPLTGTIY